MIDRAALDALLDRKMSEIEGIQRRPNLVDEGMDRILNALVGTLQSIKEDIALLDHPADE